MTSPGRFSAQATLILQRAVTTVVFVIAGLSFTFGFGNGWLLGLQLGVAGWIAPLVAPAVDLSVVALLATLQYLRASGESGRLLGPRALLVFCGLVTFALNTTYSLLDHAYGRACFDAIAPLLLIGWSEVGPGLLATLHGTVPDRPDHQDETSREQNDRTAVDAELLEQARQFDAEHRRDTSRPITRDVLRAKLHVSNAMAGQLVRAMRRTPG